MSNKIIKHIGGILLIVLSGFTGNFIIFSLMVLGYIFLLFKNRNFNNLACAAYGFSGFMYLIIAITSRPALQDMAIFVLAGTAALSFMFWIMKKY